MISKIIVLIYLFIGVLNASTSYKSDLNEKLFLNTDSSFYTINLATLYYYPGYVEFSDEIGNDRELFVFEFGEKEVLTKVLYGRFKTYNEALEKVASLPSRVIKNNKPYINKIGKFQELYIKYHSGRKVVEREIEKNTAEEVISVSDNTPSPVEKIVSFKESLSNVLSSHPEIKEKVDLLASIEYDEKISISKFLPTVDISYKKANIDDAYRSHTTLKTSYKEEDITATWNIFNGFKDYNEYKLQKSKYVSTTYEKQQVVDEVIFGFIKAYLGVVKDKQLLQLSSDNLEEYKKLMEKEKLKAKHGMSSMSKSLELEGKYITVKMNYEDRLQKYFDSLYLLQRFIDVSDDTEVLGFGIDFDVEISSIEDMLNIASKKNGYILQALEDIKIMKQQLNQEYKDFLPTVDLIATKSKRDDVFTDKTEVINERTLLLQGQMNLFNGGKDYNEIQSKLKLLSQKQNKAKAVKNKVDYQIKVILQKYKTLKANKHYSIESFENAKSAYEASSYDFKFAKVGADKLFDSLDRLYATNLTMVEYRYNLILAKYELLYMLGNIQTIINSRSS